MKEYTIKEISELFQLPASTIRYYEEEGVLTNIARTASGRRIFTEGHVNHLLFQKHGNDHCRTQALFLL